tara:strand:- start:334 stop:519 length:186 start_codon:yes stop_codon:yes gene_type:complete
MDIELIGVLFMTLMFGQLIWSIQKRLNKPSIKEELADSNIIYLTGSDVQKMLDEAEKKVFQ